jgi:hypothetical protein
MDVIVTSHILLTGFVNKAAGTVCLVLVDPFNPVILNRFSKTNCFIPFQVVCDLPLVTQG